MGRLMSWEEIKIEYPELAQKLKDGDIPSRVEFVRLALGGEIIEENNDTK
jgi:hypothetical protein